MHPLLRNWGFPPSPNLHELGAAGGKTLISKLQVVLPGCYLLFVACQGFPEPAKTQPSPQGLQSLRRTNNTQPRHEICLTAEELGATPGLVGTYFPVSSLAKPSASPRKVGTPFWSVSIRQERAMQR